MIGANIVKAISETFGADKYIACFAHVITLVPVDATKNLKNYMIWNEKILKYILKERVDTSVM